MPSNKCPIPLRSLAARLTQQVLATGDLRHPTNYVYARENAEATQHVRATT
jgi:hypothetical protein